MITMTMVSQEQTNKTNKNEDSGASVSGRAL